MENDERSELEEQYERRLHAELAAMRAAYEDSMAKSKATYDYQLSQMLELCNNRVTEARRKAQNLYDGAMQYKEYLEEYSRQYGTDVISVNVRDDGVWFLIERKDK